MHACMNTYIHLCIHIYIYIHRHVHAYIHTHTRTSIFYIQIYTFTIYNLPCFDQPSHGPRSPQVQVVTAWGRRMGHGDHFIVVFQGLPVKSVKKQHVGMFCHPSDEGLCLHGGQKKNRPAPILRCSFHVLERQSEQTKVYQMRCSPIVLHLISTDSRSAAHCEIKQLTRWPIVG